ncbi:MAG: M24 family metallopeptidase [bacterium]
MVATKINQIKAKLLERGLDALVVTKPLDIYFLANVKKFLNLVELKPTMIITANQQFILGDPVTIKVLKELSRLDFVYITVENREFLNHGGIYLENLIEILNQNHCRKIGVDSWNMELKLHEKFNTYPSENLISYYAMLKDDQQISLLKKASGILIECFNKSLNFIQDGITELEMRNFFDLNIHNLGADRLGVPTIIAFGPEALAVDPVPTQRSIMPGQLAMIEISAGVETEAPLMGRTFFYDKPDSKSEKILSKLLKVYQKLHQNIQPGKLSSSVYDQVYKNLDNLAPYLNGICGYGLGASSDFFYIAPHSNHVFRSKEACVTSLSLGIPDLGVIRFTDTVLVGEPLEILTDYPYQLILPASPEAKHEQN